MYRQRVPSLLVVHHTSSPSLQAMLEAVLVGAHTDQVDGVEVVVRPTLTAKTNAPYGLYVHGNSDTAGATRAVESITKGMGWRRVHDHVTVIDKPDQGDLDACWDLGATVAAVLAA